MSEERRRTTEREAYPEGYNGRRARPDNTFSSSLSSQPSGLRRNEAAVAVPALRLRRTPSPSFWLRALATLAALGLLVALGWLFNSDQFYVDQANVTGNRLLTQDEIYQASGLAHYSVFYVDPASAAANLRRLAYVKDAVVRIHLPNQVDIQIVERQPAAIWTVNGDEKWVDSDGVVVPPRGSADKLIRIADPNGAARRSDGGMDLSILQGALSLHDLVPSLSGFNYSTQYGLNYVAPEGWQVYMGDGSDMPTKVNLLAVLREQIMKQNAHPKLIDLRYKDRAYYK